MNAAIEKLLFAGFMAMMIMTDLQAAGIESLIMPGELIEGHAKYEDECTSCHRLFSKESQNRLCLDCHEDIDGDVTHKQGFHGLAGLGREKCSSCHEDHKGREAQVAQFSPDTFNHDLTDYPLDGRHVGVPCRSCHEETDKYRDAPGQCIDCHRDHDVHEDSLGEQCDDCHNTGGWRDDPSFDHDETDFRLRGKHRDAGCESCHASQRYENTPTDCHTCHRFSDVHAGSYGDDCADCHREDGWKKIAFDHDGTDFPLTGRHRKVACSTCHGNDVMADDLGTDCRSCHRSDDEHRGQFGEKCDECHRTSGWKKSGFDHGKTDFPLRGKHADVACNACHRGELGNEDLGKACIDCHRSDDVHAGEEGESCNDCHNEKGWSGQVRFEHDMTRFPLIGMHAVAPCEECHLTAVFTDAPGQCNDCHENDDVHERRLGPRCEDCHNPNAWTLWEFDHDTRTDFRLDGGHEGIDCHACHTKPARKKVKQSAACGSCHRDDDVHDGRFGRYCDRCHSAESFKDVGILR